MNKLFVTIFLLIPFAFFGQQNERVNTVLIQQLAELMEKEVAQLDQFYIENSSDSSALVKLSSLKANDTLRFDMQAYFDSQLRALKKETNLSYSSSFVQNFNASQADLEDNILYQRRLLNTLEWDILNDGFLETRSKLRSVELERRMLEETQKFTYERRDFPIKMSHVIYLFNLKKQQVLANRKAMLTKQIDLMEHLYFAKKISRERMIEMHAKEAEVEALNQIYSTYNEEKQIAIDSALLKLKLPLFDVKPFQYLPNDKSQLDSLKQDFIQDLTRQNNWFRTIKLSAFVRHSFYDLISTNPASRSFFSAGLNLKIPLTFNAKDNLETEKQRMLRRFDDVENDRTNYEIDVMNETYEYRYHLKQYILFYQKKLLVLEQLRQEQVKAKFLDADFNPVNALLLIDQLYQIEIELLDIKQNLYIRLMKIDEKTKGIAIEKKVQVFDLPNIEDFEQQTYKTTYVWSKAFELHSVEFLSEYLLYNHFDEVQLAVSAEDSQVEKKIAFINACYAKGIKVNLMFGQNTLLDEKNPEQVMMKSLNAYPISKISGITLDVEPHTLAEWKTQPERLKSSYLNILQQSQKITSSYNIQLAVDLPLTLDSVYLTQVMKLVNKVHFMCYENVKTSYITRKVQPFLSLGIPCSISLRTEDFASRKELEDKAKELVSELSVSQINFHDISRLIKMDEQSLEENEKH